MKTTDIIDFFNGHFCVGKKINCSFHSVFRVRYYEKAACLLVYNSYTRALLAQNYNTRSLSAAKIRRTSHG